MIQNSSSTVSSTMLSSSAITSGGASPAASAAATMCATRRACAVIWPSSVESSVRATFASEISPISAKLDARSSDRLTADCSASSRSAVALL